MPLCSFFAGEYTREAIHDAKTAIRELNAFKKLGYAMHFLQDAGNPWHSRPLLPSWQKNHKVYEEYVAKNMREGFCFRRILLNASVSRSFYHEFAQKIGEGAAHLARQSAREFTFLDTSIRTDPAWQESEDVAAVTASILTSCLQMCETQIHAFTIRAASQVQRPIRLPVAVTLTFLGSDKRRLIL